MSYVVRSLLLLVLIAGLAACPGNDEPEEPPAPAEPEEPVEVRLVLTEFDIESPMTTFQTGVTYNFVLVNEGALEHDWMIMPRGETDISQALIYVDESELPPGTTLTREFTFTEPGEYEFACHVPGHYEADMLLEITVE